MNFKNISKKFKKISNIKISPQITRTSFIKRIGLKRLIAVLVIILVVGGTVGSVYYFRQYQSLKVNPNLIAQKETEALVLAVSKIMELPTDETPTIATVLDREKLKDQSFFSKAENNDKILVYTKAMQAILYRPSVNKIINVAPIDISNQQEGEKQDEK